MDLGVKLNIERISGLIHLLAERVPKLYFTKLLKLLYIIDEIAVKETGVPVTWLKYRVWKRGPVAKYVFDEIKFYDGENLKDKIRIEGNEYGLVLISIKKFENSEFSKYEIDLFDRVISEYGNKTSEELVEYTHKKGGLWNKVVQERKLEEKFSDEAQKSLRKDTESMQPGCRSE